MGAIDIRGTINPVHCIWHVPALWVSELFQEKFWSRVHPYDSSALRMPKHLGCLTTAGSTYTGAVDYIAQIVPERFVSAPDLTIRRVEKMKAKTSG